MTDTDRIAQMAREAGFEYFESINDFKVEGTCIGPTLARFARLVAEDCAKVADAHDFGPIQHGIGDAIRARYSKESE